MENPNLCLPGWVRQAVSTPSCQRRRLSALTPTPTAKAGAWSGPHSLGLAALEPGERTYSDRLPSQDLQALSPGQGLRTSSQSPRKQNQLLPDQGSPVKGGLAPKPLALEA